MYKHITIFDIKNEGSLVSSGYTDHMEYTERLE